MERAIKPLMIQKLFEDEELVYKKILNLLSSDLENPKIEARARKFLSSLRENGYDVISFDLEEKDCLGCLHLALTSAADALELPRITH
jgi:hypothetical protein